MRKQRVRTLKELYEITQQLVEPEITPVLKGSCRIQGPIDEVDLDVETNLAVLPTEKGFGKYYSDEDIHMKASGTCNVCAAPCSSCMHFNRAISFMESKAEVDISENSCGRKEADNFSFSNSEMPSFCKNKPCNDLVQAASETSKIFSSTSSHDSYSENAESEGTARNLDVHDASEDVDMPLKLTSFETVEENQLLVERNDISLLPREPTSPNMVQRTSSSLRGDHHGLECHGDNISCVTGHKDVNVASGDPSTNLSRKNMPCTSASTRGLLGRGFKMAAQAQAADSENVDMRSIPHKTGKFAEEPSQKKGTTSDSLNVGFLHNHLESSSLNEKPSPKEQCLNSNCEIRNSFCNNSGSKDVEKDSSPQLQAQHSESILEPEKSPMGWQMRSSALDEQKCKRDSHATDFANYESSKASSTAIDVSSPRGAYQCLGTKTGGADGNPTDVSVKHCILNEQHEKPSSSSDTCNLQGTQSESKPMLDGDGPDPETLEDDVKVCDICGDAGREDLLAICSRCSDGAEHTYCMRIMLDKVPEGDWLCEECMLKDAVTDKMEKSETKVKKSEIVVTDKMEKSETKMEKSETVVTDQMDKSETVLGTLKALCSNEKVQKVGSTSIPKLLPKLDISTNDAEVPLVVKGLKSPQVSAKRPSSIVDVVSQSNKKHSDTSGVPAMTASPSRKSMLSRESSFKNLDSGKAKQGNFASPSANQSCNVSQVSCRSLAPGPNSSRVHGQLQGPPGSLSKSSSFNSPKPVVKQVTENVTQKSQVIKEYATGDVKEGFVRTLSKSASCKHINSGNSNIAESTIKFQSANPHRFEDSRNPRQNKERITEKKNSLLFNRTPPSSLQASAPSVLFSKADTKVVQNDGKINGLSESNASYPSKGSDDAHDKGLTELRKQSSHASKTCGVHASNGASNLADQRPAQIALREDAHIGSSGDVNTVPQCMLTHLSNRDEKIKDSSTFGSSRPSILPPKRILRCQKCNETGHSTQFCSVDKLRVSALKPSAERSSKEATNKGSKWKNAADAAISKVRMQKNLPDQSEEVSSTDISSEIVSQNHSSSSSCCVKDLPTVEGTADKQNGLRSSTVNDVKQHAPLLMGAAYTSKDGESNATCHGGELKEKPSLQIQPELHSVPFDPLRVSALPDHEYIWQGSFEVKRAGRLPELCDGVQAHLSTCASPKVLKVVNKFSDKVLLEEVARLSSWPSQFQENNPTEESIALFFFAKDVPSYEKSYSKLLESMLKNDLALKANFDGIELLIFPSSKLPEKSQRWNQLFFLWGVFRERRPNCLGTPSGLHSNTTISNFNLEHVVHDLPTRLVTEVAATEKESSHRNMNKDISRHDKSINTEGTSNQGAPDGRLHPGRSTSDSNAAPEFSASEQTDSHDTSPKSRIQKNTTQLCLEVKDNSSCQNESITGSDGRKDDVLPVSVQNSRLQNVQSHADSGLSAVHMITSNPWPPDLNIDSQDMEDVYLEPTMHQCSSLTVLGASAVVESNDEKTKDIGKLIEKGAASDSVITEDKIQDMRWVAGLPNKKRALSHSPERVSESFGEASVGTNTEVPWRHKTECILHDDDERESKKIRVHSEAPACSGSGVDIFGDKMSSKVHPLLANFLNEQPHLNKSLHALPPLPESSKKSERYFFPFDYGSATDTKSGSLIPLQILSSDDEYEYQQESDTPNLELALGAEKRPVKPEILPMPFPLVAKDKNKGKLPNPTVEDGDDESASLSLSLAFPFSGKEQSQMSVPKTDQLLPQRAQVNPSLLLFRPFADS